MYVTPNIYVKDFFKHRLKKPYSIQIKKKLLQIMKSLRKNITEGGVETFTQNIKPVYSILYIKYMTRNSAFFEKASH